MRYITIEALGITHAIYDTGAYKNVKFVYDIPCKLMTTNVLKYGTKSYVNKFAIGVDNNNTLYTINGANQLEKGFQVLSVKNATDGLPTTYTNPVDIAISNDIYVATQQQIHKVSQKICVTQLKSIIANRIICDSSGNVYVSTANTIIKIEPNGNQTELRSGLNNPNGMVIKNDILYIAETGANRVGQISVNGGAYTIYYTGYEGYTLNQPKGICLDTNNNIIVVDAVGCYRLKFDNITARGLPTLIEKPYSDALWDSLFRHSPGNFNFWKNLECFNGEEDQLEVNQYDRITGEQHITIKKDVSHRNNWNSDYTLFIGRTLLLKFKVPTINFVSDYKVQCQSSSLAERDVVKKRNFMFSPYVNKSFVRFNNGVPEYTYHYYYFEGLRPSNTMQLKNKLIDEIAGLLFIPAVNNYGWYCGAPCEAMTAWENNLRRKMARAEAESIVSMAVGAIRGGGGSLQAASAALAAEERRRADKVAADKETARTMAVALAVSMTYRPGDAFYDEMARLDFSRYGSGIGLSFGMGGNYTDAYLIATRASDEQSMLESLIRVREKALQGAVQIAQTAATERDPDIMHDFIYRIPVETGYLRDDQITANDSYFFYNMATLEGGPYTLAGRDSRGHMYLRSLTTGDIIRFIYDLNNPYNKAPFWTNLGRFVNLSKYLGMNLESYSAKDDDNLYTNFSGVMSGTTKCIEYTGTPFIFQNYDKLTTFGGEDVCLRGTKLYVCNSNGIYSTDGLYSSTSIQNLKSIYCNETDLYISNGNQIIKNNITYAGSATTSGQNGGLLTNAKFTTTKGFAKTSGGVEYILDGTGIWKIQTEYVNEVFKSYGTNNAFAVNSLNMYVSSGGNVKEISLYSSTETNIPGVTNPRGITIDANNAIYVADSNNNAIYRKSSTGTTLQIYISNTANNLMNSPIQYLKNNISEYVVCSNNIILITPPTANFAQISIISKNTGKNIMVNANLYTPTIDTRTGATTTYVSNTQLNQLKTGGNSFVPLNFLEVDLGKEFIIESIVYYIEQGQNINISLYFYDNKRIMSIDPIINYSLLNSTPTNLERINYVFQNIYPIIYTKARYIGVATTGKTSQVAVINSAGLNVALMRMTGTINPTDGAYNNKSIPLSYNGTFTIDLGTEHEIRKVVYYSADGDSTTTAPVDKVLVSTYAGNGTAGFVSGSARDALFRQPISMVFDSTGNMYVSDYSNHCIRKITPDGIVSRFAGSGTPIWADGTGAGASFNNPVGLAIDSANNIYVADQFNHCIRKITPGAAVSTIAGTGAIGGSSGDGGPATSARLYNPAGVAVDTAGNVYITDQANHRIRKVSNGIITTFAGSGTGTLANGTGAAASFSSPSGITIDSNGNLYIGDQWNHSIRMITPGGVVSTIAGTNMAGYADATGAAARFNRPYGLVLDSNRNIYVADSANSCIRKITQAGVVTTIAGSGTGGFINGLGSAASFNQPYGIAMDNNGIMYVADFGNHSIRKLTGTSASIILINSLGIQVESRPFVGGLTKEVFDFRPATEECGMVNLAPSKPVDAIRYVRYTPKEMAAIRQIVVYDKNGANIAVGSVSTLAGSGVTTPFANGPRASASFNNPFGVAVDSAGNVYVTDQSNHRIRMITRQGEVSTFAGTGTAGSGDGPRANATFNEPLGICIDSANNIYIADYTNARIRRITSAGVVSTIVSSGIDKPYGIAVDSAGNLYIADWWQHRIVKATLSGGTYTTSVFAGGGAAGNIAGNATGTGTAALFRNPCGIAVDPAGNVYITDALNHLIRKITPERVVTTLAGSGTGAGNWIGAFADGIGTNASFSAPSHIVIDSFGNLIVTDSANHRIRKVTPDGVVTTIAGSGSATWADGVATAAGFSNPAGIAIDASGNIYFVDRNNHRIRTLTNSQITDRVYKLNSSDTEIYPPLPATTALSTTTSSATTTSTTPPQSITIDLGAAYDITGVSIITTPNYIPRLIDSRVQLLNASSIQQQECILRGGNVREDILFTYTYNTMARYIRIENPLPSFFASNEYNNTSGFMNISSFEAYDIYGKNILEGKPYRFSTSSNYNSSSTKEVLQTYIKTNAKWIEYDIGKDTAIFSVKLTSNTQATNQATNHRFMKNAPIIFYNETRGQTRKYFFTNPYIPYVNGVATATILPYINVTNRGNFTLNTNPTEKLDVRLTNQVTAQPFTFKTMGAGILSFYFNIINMYDVNPYTISVTSTRTGRSETYTATTNITLSEPEYTITITFNGNANSAYYNACNTIQPKINDVRKWYDKETNVITRNYQRGGFTKTTSYTWWKMSYETVTAYYWSWTGVNVYMILLNNPWGNPLAKYGYPYGSVILEKEPFRGIGYDIYGYRRESAGVLGFIFLIFTIMLSFIPGMGVINYATGFSPMNYVMVNQGIWSARAAALARDAADFARLEAAGAAVAAVEARLALVDTKAEATAALEKAAASGTELATIMTQIISIAVSNSLFTSNIGPTQMTDAEKDRQTRLKYAAVSAAVAFNTYSISIGIDDEITGIVAARGAAAGSIAGEIQGQLAAGRAFTRRIDAIIDAADKGATAGAEAGGLAASPFPDALPAMAAGAAAGAAMAAATAARLVGLSYVLGDESAVGAIAAKAAITTRQAEIYGTQHMAFAASSSVAGEIVNNQFDPLSYLRGPSWLWADYAVFGMRMARPFDIQEFVWEDGSVKEDDVTDEYVNKIKSRYISARYLDKFKIYMTDTWNVLPRIANKYDTSLVSLNAARDAVTLSLVKYISTDNSWVQINRIPTQSTNTNPSISSDLFPQLLSQSISTSFPDQQTSVITTGLTSVQYISFSFTSQIKLNQIAVIDKRGINVAAGKPLVLTGSVNTNLTNGNYYTQLPILSFVLDLGAAYDISTISIYNFESTTEITLHIYKSDRTWHTLVTYAADNQSLIIKGTASYTIRVPETPITIYSIYFNNSFHDSCKPQHAGVGAIIRYITMSLMNIRVCVTDTAGQILWNDIINNENNELDLGEEHNIASIYVGNTAATIVALKNTYRAAMPIPTPSSTAAFTIGTSTYTPTYKIYSFI